MQVISNVIEGTFEVEEQWDSDEDMSNQKFWDGQKIDYFYDGSWINAEVEKTLDEIICLKVTNSYREVESKWVNPYQKLAPEFAMTMRKDVLRINQINTELQQSYHDSQNNRGNNINFVQQDSSSEEDMERDNRL